MKDRKRTVESTTSASAAVARMALFWSANLTRSWFGGVPMRFDSCPTEVTLEVLRQFFRRGVAVTFVFRHGPITNRNEFAWNSGIVFGEIQRAAVNDDLDDVFVGGMGGERCTTSEDSVNYGSERIDIGEFVYFVKFSGRLFWRHVQGRPEHFSVEGFE